MEIPPPPKLLIVDDDPVNLEILEVTLEGLEVSFVRAGSGEEALALLEEHDVAMVMMDVQMPGMDGLETLRRMREVSEWALIPVILITAVYKEDDAMIEGIETGAVDFLPKPFDHRVLQGKVRSLVDLYQERRRLEMEIQRRRAVEAELTAAKEAAELANRSKSEFLANMSHDIRTPMNAILGMADMLHETPLNREQKKYINIFQSAGRNLLGLINDILDLSKIESGQITYEKAIFNLPDLVESTSEVFALSAHDKGLELVVFVYPDVPEVVLGDAAKLRQILSNMIGNAVKFTHAGEIVVEVKRVPSIIKLADSNQVELLFSVRDTGIGIHADNLERIFTSFQQEDSSTTRRYGGTGLGLTISKKLVRGMGGQITLTSELGRGSCFEFNIVFEIDDSAAGQQDTPPDLNGLNVLILDGNQAVNRMVAEIVTSWGGVVEQFENEDDPLMKIQSLQADGDPLFVVLSCIIKGQESFELIREVKQHPVLNCRLLVMLSTKDSHKKIEKLKTIGIEQYLIKPLKIADLKRGFRQLLGTEPTGETGPNAMETKVNSGVKPSKHILLVDDSVDNRLLIQAFLKKTTHTLVIAEHGKAGVEKFKSARFDLVLMDIHMPVMDGLTATREIRQWENEEGRERTRIAALTANAMDEDEKTSLEAGCDCHLTKPISKARLLETIEETP